MNILALLVGHDGSAALVQDGKLVAAIHEERLSRIKKDASFPRQAIQEVIRQGSIKPEDIDLVAVVNTRDVRSKAQLDKLYHRKESGRVTQTLSQVKRLFGTGKLERHYLLKGIKELGIQAEIIRYNHHLCHAASTYYTADFEDPLIITLDGRGDYFAGTVNVIKDGKITRIHAVDIVDSPGYFYGGVTRHLGLKPMRHEGKVTGLAAYGDRKKYFKQLQQLFWYEQGGKNLVSKVFRDIEKNPVKALTSFAFDTILGNPGTLSYKAHALHKAYNNILPPVRDLKTDRKIAEDIAASTQYVLEEAVIKFVTYWKNKTGKKNICLAGGIFANVKLNQFIHEIPGVEQVFIHPGMGDEGLPAGAALLASAEREGTTPYRIPNVYLGPEFDDKTIQKAAQQHGITLKKMKNPTKEIATHIANGKIVGHFRGRMEYGPRALGNRTIFALPTDPTINDWLNTRLKRTEFMPFAPIILAEDVHTCYKGVKGAEFTAEFMTITFDVKKQWTKKAPAVSHIDDTARPQIVTKQSNPYVHKILTHYKKLTGLPMCINTSFNMHEEPIVCTPEDAIRAFKAGSVDVLVLEDYISIK